MHFEDLSPYEYHPVREQVVRNVGWLEPPNPFATGSFDASLLQKLKHISVLELVGAMRGFHYCGFCAEEDIVIEVAGRRRMLGTAEIWVPSAESGLVYAAPNLIVHYIQQHQYLPPAEFVTALERLDVSRPVGREAWERLAT